MCIGKLMVCSPHGFDLCPLAFSKLEGARCRAVVLTNRCCLAHVVHACGFPIFKETFARCCVAVIWEVWLRRDVEVCMAESGGPWVVVITEWHGRDV